MPLIIGIIIFIAVVYALAFVVVLAPFWIPPLLGAWLHLTLSRKRQFRSLPGTAVHFRYPEADIAFQDTKGEHNAIRLHCDDQVIRGLATQASRHAFLLGLCTILLIFSVFKFLQPSNVTGLDKYAPWIYLIGTVLALYKLMLHLHSRHVDALKKSAITVVRSLNEVLFANEKLESIFMQIGALSEYFDVKLLPNASRNLLQHVIAHEAGLFAHPDLLSAEIDRAVVTLEHEVARLAQIKSSLEKARALLRNATNLALEMRSPSLVDYLDQYYFALQSDNLTSLLVNAMYDDVEHVIEMATTSVQELLRSKFAGVGEHRRDRGGAGEQQAESSDLPSTYAAACAVLHVRPDATCGQAKQNYRRLTSMLHPDHGGETVEQQKIVRAWAIFRDARGC